MLFKIFCTASKLGVGIPSLQNCIWKSHGHLSLSSARWRAAWQQTDKTIITYTSRKYSKMASFEKCVKFRDGKKMPIIGLGTWQGEPKETEAAVDAALEVGYRHLDTAFVYGNEEAIGRALKKWFDSGKIKREDLFITTKLPPAGNHAESVEKYLKKSLESLQLDYVDLYLIHTPIGLVDKPWAIGKPLELDMTTDLVAVWKAMEEQVDAGRTKAIGVSNFNKEQLQRIAKSARILPANLQVELHAYLQQPELMKACKELGVTVVSYATLGSPGRAEYLKKMGVGAHKIPDLLDNSIVVAIAKKHNKTPAQVLLRHMIQNEIVVIPKSVKPERIRQNFQVFDFELTSEDMAALNKLDQGEDGRSFTGTGQETHPEFPHKKK